MWACVHTHVCAGLQGSKEKAEEGWERGQVSSTEEERRAAQTSKGSQGWQLEQNGAQGLQGLPPWGVAWGALKTLCQPFPNYLRKVNLTQKHQLSNKSTEGPHETRVGPRAMPPPRPAPQTLGSAHSLSSPCSHSPAGVAKLRLGDQLGESEHPGRAFWAGWGKQ